MTVESKPIAYSRKRSKRSLNLQLWLDIGLLITWGALLLKFWLTDKINILLHPNYVWLAITAGFCLLGLALIKGLQIRGKALPPTRHISLLPPGWSSILLIMTALIGLQFTPQPFSSQTALQRGVTDTLTMTRSQPQAFRSSMRPEDKSLIDWVRTLNVYPEPDAYAGQPAQVDGFVIHPPELPDDYLLLSRFVITCCAADVYPVGLPVKLSQDRSAYPQDQWYRVEGEMITETLNDQRQLVILANQLTAIDEPENPYEY